MTVYKFVDVKYGNFVAVNRRYCVVKSRIDLSSTALRYWLQTTLVPTLINVSCDDCAFFGYVIVQRINSANCGSLLA